MIQFKSKHKYSSKSDRWYKMLNTTDFENLDFEDYNYIIGDAIFTEPSEEAKKAHNMVMLWSVLS